MDKLDKKHIVARSFTSPERPKEKFYKLYLAPESLVGRQIQFLGSIDYFTRQSQPELVCNVRSFSRLRGTPVYECSR